MTFVIHDRLKAAAEVHDLPLEPLITRTFDLWDGNSRTVLGYGVTGEASQEHLWIRALEHWRPTQLTLHEGLWWPPSEPLGGLHPELGDEGPRVVLGALGTEARKAMAEDLNATLVWLEEQRERQVRFTTRSALERVQGELEAFLPCLESSAAPTHAPGENRSHTQARFGARVQECLAHRLTVLEAQGAEPDHRIYGARLESELQAIRDHELQPIFYVLADLGIQARSNGIRLGPGRGALPSSLVAWLLGVTDVDPVALGLVFERWLGEEEIARRRITLEAPPKKAEALEHWARNRSRHGEANIRVLPLPILAQLERAHRIAGLKMTPHPAWNPHDTNVFEAIQNGLLDTSGLDSEGLESNLFPILPTAFQHLRDWTVLGHSWDLGEKSLLTYANRRIGKSPVPTMPDCLDAPLRETYGILLYQEQVIQILCETMGCSLREGDHLRRGLASGNPIRLEQARHRCFEDGKSRGWSLQKLDTVLDLLKRRCPWTFCQSHATARAALIFEVAWWKIYHRNAFDQAGLETQAEGTQANNHRFGEEPA